MSAAIAPQVPVAEQAIRYAKAGFELFPASPIDKAPYVTNGFYDATSDLAQVQRWWKREHPEALIACRISPQYIILDIDPRHNGHATWAKLEETYGPVAVAREHYSGRGDGGRHVWFKHPGGTLTMRALHAFAKDNGTGHKAGKTSWASGIDLLHHGYRYTILPPSLHPDTGMPYTWGPKDEPGDAPEWLVAMLTLKPAPPKMPSLRIADQDSIADWYSSTASWNDILGPSGLGWEIVDGDGDSDGSKWRHPTATAASSASIKHGCLFVYSPNTDFTETAPGDTNGYTRFNAWKISQFDGDGSAAARAAREMKDGPRPHDALNASVGATVKFEAATPDEPWPDAIPLGEAEAVAKFPTEVLPTWMQPIVAAIAEDLQAEPDLPGVLGLIALSTACAGKRHVIIRNSWREPLNIYAAVALPPSSGKSPAFKWMMGPIRRFEKERMETQQGQVEHVAQTRRMIERAMKKAEDKGDAQEARIQLDKLLTTPEVHPFRLVLDDATPEALVQKLYEHGQRLAILSTEGGPFGMMSGRYSDNANLDPYLKPWSNDSISVDRMGRGTTILDKPVLTIGLTVQPTVIAALAENPEMIGRGLTARFMYSVPRTRTGHRDMFWECDISDDVSAPYEKRITGLLSSELDADHPADITVERDAVLEFHGWRQGLENQRGEGGALHIVSEWTTKLESTVARVAGLLALADLTEHVDVPTMRRAIALGNYWLSHIRAVLDLWGRDDTVAKARQVVAWMTHRELSEFSVRDLYGSLRRLFPTADECRPVLHLLTERGWIRPLFDGPLVLGRRGVDSPRFAVRPSGLWINPPHARHADHVLKTPFDQNSLTHSESGGSTPLAHETHGAHDESDSQVEVSANPSQSVAPEPQPWDLP